MTEWSNLYAQWCHCVPLMQTQEWNEANIPRREIPVMINRGPN